MALKGARMTRYSLARSLPACLLAALLAGPAMPQATAEQAAAVQAALAEAKVRLNLTAEQEAALIPLMEERAAKLKAIRDQHAGDDSRRARRAMFRDAKPVMEDYQAKVRAILDDTQEAEWEKMRAEARERLKERYRAGQSPD
jgi:hypothetical protein